MTHPLAFASANHRLITILADTGPTHLDINLFKTPHYRKEKRERVRHSQYGQDMDKTERKNTENRGKKRFFREKTKKTAEKFAGFKIM